MYNLLSNAFKFTPDNGSVTVALSMREETNGQHAAQITVTDTGIGIPEEHLPHIFDRFYQANTSSTRKYEGTGIGLSLVKELTTLMGGDIKAESTVGKGSVFTITLLIVVIKPGSKKSYSPFYALLSEPLYLLTAKIVFALAPLRLCVKTFL